MQRRAVITNVSYCVVLLLCGYVATRFNPFLVSAIHTAADVTVRPGAVSAHDIPTPHDFLADVTALLARTAALSDAEKRRVLHTIPATVDFEASLQPPYENIFHFSLFDDRAKKGGILLLGDSTLSWGFSVDHFAAMAGSEVHALAYGRNTMEGTLLAATDRIVDCFYARPPAVVISNSLKNMRRGTRQRGPQDRAVTEIAATRNCDELYRLVARHRPEKRTSRWRKALGFRTYRAALAGVVQPLVRLQHVELHRVMEPAKFSARQGTGLYFYRWQPEFRVPFMRGDAYHTWRPHDPREEQKYLEQYLDKFGDSVEPVASMHQRWAHRDACFVLPLTMPAESAVRRHLFPTDSVCRLDLPALVRAEASALAIPMQSDHHLAGAGGIVLAAIAGKHVRDRQLPRWRSAGNRR